MFFRKKRVMIMIQKTQAKVVLRGMPVRPDAPPTAWILRMQMRMISPMPSVAMAR